MNVTLVTEDSQQIKTHKVIWKKKNIKMKVLNSENTVSIVEYVKNSEVSKNTNSPRIFDYYLNDKTSKAKILKSAKRNPMETEENSSSTNIVFSAGALAPCCVTCCKIF